MKIGIVTFWYSNDNYGQLLQCYALQQQLKRMGHDPFLIKYNPVVNGKNKKSIWKKILRAVLIYPIFKKIFSKIEQNRNKKYAAIMNLKNTQRKFDDFRTQYIVSDDRIYNDIDSIQRDPPKADCYMCGSDQVWGRQLNNADNEGFFLNFGKSNVKRVAYAPSFGRDVYPKELNEQLHEALLRFDAVSVREETGVNICARVGIKAKCVLDPSLLLSEKDYMPVIEQAKREKKYFYTYSINVKSKAELFWNELSTYARELGLHSITSTSSGCCPGRELCDDTEYVYATIPQWLGYIKNAEFVATTSFHGVAFCLIFHKNFIYFPLEGAFASGNNRVHSLLKLVGLLDKICHNKAQVRTCIEQKIDWKSVESKLNILIAESILFLERNLYKVEMN